MKAGWQVITNAKTKYVLEWDEWKSVTDYRETYDANSKKMKDFVNFDDLHEYYQQLLVDKRNKNIIGYRMEWIDLDKKPKLPGYRGSTL